MRCPKCGEQNSRTSLFCHACQSPLVGDPSAAAPTGLGIQEGIEYPAPAHHYETEQLNALHDLVAGLLDGADLFDELESHLDQMAENFGRFEQQHAEKMQRLLAEQSVKQPEDDYNAQLSYVIQTGLRLFKEGRDAFDRFFETESDDPDELEAAFYHVRDGNDYLCLALEMAHQRYQLLVAQFPEAADS